MRDHVREQIKIILGMIEIQVKIFKGLRDRSTSNEYIRGVQDCIDALEEAILTGMSVTDDEIDTKHKNMKAALETKLANKISGDN